ncbi:cytochrome P450 [Sabulicella rubraurantiaca]|uniref:cytochrome P450 n=1 Tax=Sabulicella rubraurantiaca TaxID=2811429 RepID=UPI001A96FBD8|nr:cytochrome P450 [Sabulicella rubraurantiaca]
MAALPSVFAVARRVWPIPGLGSFRAVTRHDDVREVFGTDTAFRVPYQPNLNVITGGEPFFLGMDDTPEYRAGVAAMRRVVRADDLPALALRTEEAASNILSHAGGRIDVVDLARRVAFDVVAPYFGVPPPAQGRLDVWATRLFEFQFASSPKDIALRREVDEIAPAFRALIDAEIARRKSGGAGAGDDVLDRCLAQQAAGDPWYTDPQIRTSLLCMVVGGPPQWPMVVPQALEQLLQRPEALEAARSAAQASDDDRLRRIVLEAMRFDPLGPGLPRIARRDWSIAQGTRRQTKVRQGATVFVAFSSAMMDDRRVPEPRRFDTDRGAHEYIHFGYGLHECFGKHINHACLPRLLKPLLRHPNLQRAAGKEGTLTKNGIFAERLVVTF